MKLDLDNIKTDMTFTEFLNSETVRPMIKTFAYTGVALLALATLGAALTAYYSETDRDKKETWFMLSPLAVFGGVLCIPVIYLALRK